MQSTRLEEVKKWLITLGHLVETHTCQSPEFLRPFHLATLALVLKSKKAAQLGLPEHLIDYACRMKLWESIGITPPDNNPESKAASRYQHPIERLVSQGDVHDCAGRLASITKLAQLDQTSVSSLGTSISELLDNCYSHGGSKEDLQGVACAQYWPNGHLAQIAIADSGVGVRWSLERAEADSLRNRAKNSNCCALATELGVTSKPTRGHAGYGLALARQLLAKNGGTLIVCSGREWCIGSGSDFSSGRMEIGWSGTLVVAEFNTDRPLRTQDVYGSWPPVRGYTNDDFDF
jgi:anti-sigma regulatory factor (Ser/Thr protein kinase)